MLQAKEVLVEKNRSDTNSPIDYQCSPHLTGFCLPLRRPHPSAHPVSQSHPCCLESPPLWPVTHTVRASKYRRDAAFTLRYLTYIMSPIWVDMTAQKAGHVVSTECHKIAHISLSF